MAKPSQEELDQRHAREEELKERANEIAKERLELEEKFQSEVPPLLDHSLDCRVQLMLREIPRDWTRHTSMDIRNNQLASLCRLIG